MKTASVVVLALLSSLPRAEAQSTVASKPESSYTSDVDLKSAPDYYRRRVIEFRNILRKESTRETKVKKALSIAADPKSKYRRDAIAFLGDVRAKEAVPVLIQIAKERNEREFSLHALGEIRNARAVPVLIHYLSDPSENVRGNAYRSLEKTVKKTFSYRYDDAPSLRLISVKEIEHWWEQNSATFRVQELSKAEAQEAEDAWQKYGRQYLQDLNR